MSNYHLLIADPSYSSWSLRGWLAFTCFGIDVKTSITRLYDSAFQQDLKAFAPAKTVPVVRVKDGTLFTDSLSIIEELASRHPEAGLLPEKGPERARARNLMAEMHSGFMALRGDCPMNSRVAYLPKSERDEVIQDLRRLELLWQTRTDENGWLCGAYSAADVMFAPVAARIAGYGLDVNDNAKAYVKKHLHHLPFRQFRALGLTFAAQDFYYRDWPTTKWPGPQPLPAKATIRTDAVNDTCPYSGLPTTHYLALDDKVYGFCNERCRDKTVNDAEAFPEFMALVAKHR
ncbi:MAG: glutathione S-transferase [Candidatus Puniceispirillaceae bacterium]